MARMAKMSFCRWARERERPREEAEKGKWGKREKEKFMEGETVRDKDIKRRNWRDTGIAGMRRKME